MTSPQVIERQIQAQGGSVPVSFGGCDTWGLLELPAEDDEAYDGAQLVSARPSVIVANGILPGIGVDIVDGARGRDEVVIVKGHSFRVVKLALTDPDGGTVRLELGDE